MSQTIHYSTGVVAEAQEAADAAARRAEVAIRGLESIDDQRAASRLLDQVWSADGVPLLPGHLLRASAHAGNYLVGAWSHGAMIGVGYGFLGQTDGVIRLHSHVVGIDPRTRHRGIGFAIKQHQRAWALVLGLTSVTWTFDPLVSRNAYFNISKLGAEVVGYDRNFYGAMDDGVNGGDETDRAHVRWNLNGERAAAASNGRLAGPSIERLRREGATVALDVSREGSPAEAACSGPTVLCRVPTDIASLRGNSPHLARAWRRSLRAVLGHALSDGYAATGMTKDGWYVLERDAAMRQ